MLCAEESLTRGVADGAKHHRVINGFAVLEGSGHIRRSFRFVSRHILDVGFAWRDGRSAGVIIDMDGVGYRST